ncbi:hypothetical protein K493DRAFT_319906 [Basidiobolus meristosporus CBS 931.73]|uniref:BTB domain-containing protein n=1 Tax=Basidiobolus meristosporus CBS 931.73 TaxID=1314790 RepID=A0A1Y1XJ19_9FUNG|nr:hypothetical protein K493DRAFT_319906 [Basidiobolus meristosporus CBS 931.73]|eukprot:ORX85757.1 hypothetical protein K493DRAFT_319906 [Basidiobolus meristosporus CBS 931.73]
MLAQSVNSNRLAKSEGAHLGQRRVKLITGEFHTTHEILSHRHTLAPLLFNDQESSDFLLRLFDAKETREIWVHDFLLVNQSQLFACVFRKCEKQSNNCTNNNSICSKIPISMSFEGKEVRCVELNVPCITTFVNLLKWLYDHNDKAWMDTFTRENFQNVLENIAYLRLGMEAYDVCAEFYETF